MAMLRESRSAGDESPLVQADAAVLPFLDGSFDGVVVFRFLHHLDEARARQVLAEATRVARAYVVVSFFHPVSFHGVMRRCKERLTGRGRARTRFAVTAGTLARWMRDLGFEPTTTAADQAFRRDFWVTAFRRSS